MALPAFRETTQMPGPTDCLRHWDLAHSCRELVNAVGLAAQRVVARIDGRAQARVPTLRLAKGNHFSLAGRSPFSRLIDPVPNEAGPGVHLTLDLAGQARFGPDVEWIDEIDYQVGAWIPWL